MDTEPAPEHDKGTLLILLLIVIFVPVILLILQSFQKEETIIVQAETSSQTVFPTVNETRWNTYNGETFYLQYPPEWTASSYPIPNGEAVIMKSSALPPDYLYPQFTLQTEPASTNAMRKKKAVFEGYGMTKTDVIVEDTPAIKYKGTIPSKKEPLQGTTILMQKKNMLYVFTYEYEGVEASETFDNYFNDFIRTFRSK